MGQFLGIHCTSKGSYVGLTEYLRDVRRAGKPLSIQSVGSTVGVYDAQLSGYHHHDGLVFRQEVTKGENLEYLPVDSNTGKYTGDPEAFGDYRWDRTIYHWPPELDPTRIYTVMVNEPSERLDNIEFVARFTLQQGKRAVKEGRRYLAYGWGAGCPEREFWEHPITLEYLRLCEQHPRLLGVSLHEYSLNTTDLKYESPWHIGRVHTLYDVCAKHGIRKPYVHIGEFGWSLNKAKVSDTEAKQQFSWTKELYGKNNISTCVWTLGDWSGDIVSDVEKIMDVITNEAVTSVIDDVEEKPLPKIVIYKFPQEYSLEEWKKLAEELFTKKRTTTFSTDDTFGMLYRKDISFDSYAVIVNPEQPSQQECIELLEYHKIKWIKG